jgi:RNA polymerase sigma-70 factor (ECF subfamily)
VIGPKEEEQTDTVLGKVSQTILFLPSRASLFFPGTAGVEKPGTPRRPGPLKLPEDLSETDLVERLIQRDQAVFLHVYREHAPVLSRVLSRMGVPPDDVEDLLQTTFTEALAGLERFEGRSSLRSWLLSVALNQTRNYIRARIRDRANAPLLVQISSPAKDVEVQLSEAQQNMRFQRALAALPPMQREALVLCELSGLPAREVSELLGVPAGTVWRRVHDAKASLRRLLAEEDAS